jgi:hypothetical protein
VFGLQKLGVLLLYAGCMVLVLLSGKRMGLAAVLLAPAISALMFRQLIYIPVALAALFLMLSALVFGQGQWFDLPLVAQRTLSWLPGEWDPELDSMRGGTDDFRTELRRLAWDNIKTDPVVGQGYAMNMGEIMSTMTLQQQVGGIEVVTTGHAISRNWHNIWLGYAADFGIPVSIIQGIIFLQILILSFRTFNIYSNRSLLGVFSLYVFIFTFRDLIASHTSGHTALDAFERWWMYGMVVAIYLQLHGRRGRSDTEPPHTSVGEPGAATTKKPHQYLPEQ